MRYRLVFSGLLLMALFLSLAPTALASTTWYVDGVNGSDNNNCNSPQTACKTIGHAISLASSGDSIMMAAATYTENLTIGFSLKVIGSGAHTTIIDGGGGNTVVTISNANAHVALSRVTVRNGFAPVGGGIHNSGTLRLTDSALSGNKAGSDGGGINNTGTLTISNSNLSGNGAVKYCKNGCSNNGGGVFNSGTLTISNSTFTGNIAKIGGACIQNYFGSGGGIFNNAAMTISDSTFRRNSAGSVKSFGHGGGIINNYGRLTISNSTFSGNSAAGDGGGIENLGALTINNTTFSGNKASRFGGGIDQATGQATLQNSIVANSLQGGNCSGTVTSNGYNLSSDGTCNFNGTGDLNNTDPKLGPLQNNGGPTQTQALLSGSPAIDAGNPSGCTNGHGNLLKTDQRGKPRPDKEDTSGCDMGAYERQSD
jgi:hypothetical protein